MAVTFDKLLEVVRDRTWYHARGVFAFLVDAPLTFGHSQLVVKAPKSKNEEFWFATAAPHIAICIRTLRTELTSRNRSGWRSLAQYTGTSGRYRKTLVLKASADETRGMYKLHLVPYFASHLYATNQLYQVLNDADHGAAGGLLHWIGQRERLVDYDMRYGREDNVVKARIVSFNLAQLALLLTSNDA